ncbi:MAG: hypothetical protein M0Z58_07070 [Nitrospiraceae bacterium]|nr:hypothetical protein [Nitrospiraceae bacterium]
MLLDVTIGKDSMTMQIDDPFHIDLNAFVSRIENFASPKGVNIRTLDVRNIIPRMIKGIAGCEHGCPADAKGFVSRGFEGFHLEYIEGGILSATAKVEKGKSLQLKMFPDF